MTNNNNARVTPSELAQARNRWVSSVRTLLLGLDPAVHHPVGDAEPVFVGGDPLDPNIIQLLTVYLRAYNQVSDGEVGELVYVEFGDVAHAGEPRAVHVVGLRDEVFLLKRDFRLWLDRDGSAALARPDRRGGSFVHQDDELVNLPGLPARNLAPGFARARTRLRELAAAMSDGEARYCFEPRRRAA